jgi:hypothetical protein
MVQNSTALAHGLSNFFSGYPIGEVGPPNRNYPIASGYPVEPLDAIALRIRDRLPSSLGKQCRRPHAPYRRIGRHPAQGHDRT